MSIGSIILNVLFGVVVIGFFGFVVYQIRKSVTKSKDPKPAEAKGDNEVDPETQSLGTNLMKVFIWRDMGGGLVTQVGDSILCQEKPDEHTNLVVVNEAKNFKEDFNFQKDRIFETLEFSLRTKGKSKKDKALLIANEINTQEELVNSLKADKKKNAQYNYNDENQKLRQLKVLRESLQMETVGNYMRLGKGGVRQFEFVAIDGILYPYFFGSKWYRVYPDLLIKKKIFNQENTIFRNEIGNLQKNILNWLLIIGLIVGFAMGALGAWMMTHAYSQNTEVTMIANQGALSCANTLAGINANYGAIINDYQKLKQKQTDNIKKSEIPSITSGGLTIDPSKILN